MKLNYRIIYKAKSYSNQDGQFTLTHTHRYRKLKLILDPIRKETLRE